MTSLETLFPSFVRGYAFRSGEYMHNAFVTLDDGQVEKASEFLWGGMALAFKAVA